MSVFCQPYFRRRDGRSIKARAASHSYTPPQVAQAYGIPTGYDGSGVSVGIVELGGAFSQSDLDAYMTALGLPRNIVTCFKVNGATIQDDPGGANVEVMLDVCIVAAIAPKCTIRCYFANNTDTDFAAAVAQAASECDVVSISWGAPETQWSASARAAMDAALKVAGQAGVNVYVAAGDNGSSDGTNTATVDYPAASPYAIACGGTALVAPNGVIQSETVWNDGSQGGATGGGFSRYYAKPSFQQFAVPGQTRGVPDVAGVADPETGWIIRADGSNGVVGGTSAVAPFWAAVNALLIQKAGGRTGINTVLYYQHPEAFRDTISGSNGDYQAGPNWDACTGMGSPNGTKLFGLVSNPPPPPPPSPPPPPPPPPGSGGLESVLQSAVDSIFADLIQQYRGRPLVVRVLKMLQNAVDLEIQKIFVSQSHGSDVLRTLAILIMDRAFALVESKLSNWAGFVAVLEELRPTVESAILKLLGI